MNFGISDLFCCIRPSGNANLQHTKVEYSGGKAYVDVFCQVDGTIIFDSDYLCVSRPPSLNTSTK